eukprot:TRINITY_DN26980_c0_g1_i1.p1 TRINITY_DN26980_c0_g1~~TRINITY_DN26980_c0_g1_i1.p1  ORF type:complete len:174 (-),score=21.27 TRINITY_DN26980_c0_g1_i1:9-470(-)
MSSFVPGPAKFVLLTFPSSPRSMRCSSTGRLRRNLSNVASKVRSSSAHTTSFLISWTSISSSLSSPAGFPTSLGIRPRFMIIPTSLPGASLLRLETASIILRRGNTSAVGTIVQEGRGGVMCCAREAQRRHMMGARAEGAPWYAAGELGEGWG